MFKLNSLMIGTENFKELTDFYQQVLQSDPVMSNEQIVGWVVGDCFFGIGPHSEVKGSAKEPQRLIFNLESEDVKGEFERVKTLGARVIKEPTDMGDDMWLSTLADPDGNFFQIVSPWKPNE